MLMIMMMTYLGVTSCDVIEIHSSNWSRDVRYFSSFLCMMYAVGKEQSALTHWEYEQSISVAKYSHNIVFKYQIKQYLVKSILILVVLKYLTTVFTYFQNFKYISISIAPSSCSSIVTYVGRSGDYEIH